MDEFLRDHPDGACRRCFIRNSSHDVSEALQPLPEAFFATCGQLGDRLHQLLTERGVRVPDEVSLLVYDGPDEAYLKSFPPVDAIEFSIPQVIDLAEYYITKRPLLLHHGPFATRVAPHLVTRGSVKEKTKVKAKQETV